MSKIEKYRGNRKIVFFNYLKIAHRPPCLKIAVVQKNICALRKKIFLLIIYSLSAIKV